jgi:diguanylate cyclase (GGDEF)-like protein
MDLDLFKNVNDSLGHSVGDELLIEIARVITSQVRAGDTVARIGGDEFVILMDDLRDGAEAVAHLAQRLCERVSQPLQVAERELQLTVSIGISLFPDDGDSMDTLLSNADLAMYRAKDQGRNTYHFFETEMTERAVQRLHLETALRGAIARNELELVYQPQFRLAKGGICGVESLLRWTHPELGTISPAKFIPVAEEIGMISELGRWVLTEACNQLTRWDAEGFRVPRLSINVSVHQVERIDLIDEIKGIIAATDVDADRLELEVTESVFMRNVERVVQNLNALRDLGIRLAVDDFGSGFSSLGYLKQLPISRLKIDKTFVDGVDTDANDSAIARAVIVLGRALGLEVIAEGVETQAQARFLENEGCDAVQGYLFARPMAAGALRDQHYAVTD